MPPSSPKLLDQGGRNRGMGGMGGIGVTGRKGVWGASWSGRKREPGKDEEVVGWPTTRDMLLGRECYRV